MKLVVQNRLCAQFLDSELRSASEMSATDADPSGGLFSDIDFACGELTFDLQRQNTLSPDDADEMLKLNRQLRTQYDQWLAGKRAFAARFGSVSQPLRAFDEKFRPNEG